MEKNVRHAAQAARDATKEHDAAIDHVPEMEGRTMNATLGRGGSVRIHNAKTVVNTGEGTVEVVIEFDDMDSLVGWWLAEPADDDEPDGPRAVRSYSRRAAIERIQDIAHSSATDEAYVHLKVGEVRHLSDMIVRVSAIRSVLHERSRQKGPSLEDLCETIVHARDVLQAALEGSQ